MKPENILQTPAATQGLELANKGGNYSPVTVTNNDTVGAAFLGIVAVLLLIMFMRAQARTRALEQQLVQIASRGV
jgi:hypothetical protein